ncbi:ATP-binding protein [Uniformispora flossi]|uniref:ATP-binding protein n=1 Tax=Uniformispora flossi TaxID=3390723 RepID=UPI003C2AD619
MTPHGAAGLAPLPDVFRVEPTTEAIANARRRVLTVASTWDIAHPDALADLGLCAIELVGHSHYEIGAGCSARLSVNGPRFRLEVIDAGMTLPTAPHPGTGLFVVAHVAAAWGAEPHAHGRVLWFEVDLEQADQSKRLAARIRAALPTVRRGRLAAVRP